MRSVAVPFLAVLVTLSCVVTQESRGQTTIGGITEGGAYYTLAVPDNWNGDLVIFNHGLSAQPPGPVTDLGPLAPLQLSEGYAVAASSYRQSRWALFKTKNDIMNMYDAFRTQVGKPQRVFINAGSMGALASVELIEQSSIKNIAGAVLACGPLGGSRIFEFILDLRLTYDAVCGGVADAFIPGGAEGLPKDSALTGADIDQAVDACTGILDATTRTAEQADRLAKILDAIEIPENFLLTDMRVATLTLADLVHTPGKLAGQLGVGNIGASYDDPDIDAAIVRVAADPGGAVRLADHYTPSGAIGGTKVVSIHTDKDGLVFVEHEAEFTDIVPADSLTTAVAVEAIPSHCGFTGAEFVAAWESLRGWVGGGPQPSAASIQGLCLAVAPSFGGPCRYDPTFVVPQLETRVPPR